MICTTHLQQSDKQALCYVHADALQVQLGPILVQLQPQLALQVLDYIKAVRAYDMTATDSLDSSTEQVVPLKQVCDAIAVRPVWCWLCISFHIGLPASFD